MEVRAILIGHDLKAIGDTLNGWRLGTFVLTKAGRASPAVIGHRNLSFHSSFIGRYVRRLKFVSIQNRPLHTYGQNRP